MNIWDRVVGAAATAALGVVFLTALVVEAIALEQTWGAEYWLVGSVAAVVVCLLALLRRRHRAGTAIAGLAVAALTIVTARVAHLPAEPGAAMALGLSVLIGSAARALPPVPAGAVAGAGLLVVAGSQLGARPYPSGSAAVAALNAAAWLAAVAIGLSLRLADSRRQAVAEKVRQDERLEMARELHDVVAHHITGILIQAQAAQLVARGHPEKTADSLARIETAGSDALAAMRRIVGLLRNTDDAAPAAPEPEQLTALIERFSQHGPPVHLRMAGKNPSWPPEVISTVYRIIQEALTNIARHAPRARSVIVTVAHEPEAVTVEVVDDAPPGPTRHHQRGGYGLIGMRERVTTLGGTLFVGPRPGAGWCVLATLPVPAREPR